MHGIGTKFKFQSNPLSMQILWIQGPFTSTIWRCCIKQRAALHQYRLSSLKVPPVSLPGKKTSNRQILKPSSPCLYVHYRSTSQNAHRRQSCCYICVLHFSLSHIITKRRSTPETNHVIRIMGRVMVRYLFLRASWSKSDQSTSKKRIMDRVMLSSCILLPLFSAHGSSDRNGVARLLIFSNKNALGAFRLMLKCFMQSMHCICPHADMAVC